MPDYITPEQRAADEEARRRAAEAQRNAAANIAAEEALGRALAEGDATDARIAANQARAAEREASTQRSIMSNELQYERAAAAGNAFGFYLVLGVLAAALVIAGAYLWWRSDQETMNVTYAASPTAPGPVVVTPPAAPQPASAQPPVVNVNPPPPAPPAQVHNNITVTPSTPAPAAGAQPGTAPGGGATGGGADGASPSGQ